MQSEPTTVNVVAGKSTYNLDPAKDYILKMPAFTWSNPAGGYGLKIVGGRNVVLIGGHVDIPFWSTSSVPGQRRGVMLENQRGTIHVEGLLVTGDDLGEGIDLNQNYGATVQIQNVHVATLHARDLSFPAGEHPDVLQTWAGPRTLRVDRLTGTTNYQGLFLSPTDAANEPGNQPYRGSEAEQQWDLRRINIHGTTSPASRYMFSVFGDTPVRQLELYGDRRRAYPPVAWNSFGHSQVDGDKADAAWYGFTDGQPSGGDFVPRETVGVGYVSPGYVR